MKTKGYIKSSPYNKGKQDSKLLIESKAKLTTLKKEKNYLSKAVNRLDFFSNENFENQKVPSSIIIDKISIPSSALNFDQINFSSESFSSELPLKIHWINSNLFNKSNCDIISFYDFLKLEVSQFLNPTKNRASEINDELRKLKLEVKQSPSTKLFVKIKQLVEELHSLITFSFRKHKNKLKNLEKDLLPLSSIDLRNLFRNRVRCLFKYFSDFSGSEEDSLALIILSYKNFFNLINRIACTIKMKLQSQLIYT